MPDNPVEDVPPGNEAAMQEHWADRAARLTTILMVGRLVTARGDHVCRVRNISPGGMMIECDVPITVGESIRVELRNMNVVEATVRWTRPPRLGVEFAQPVDVPDLLHAPPALTDRQPRAPRLTATCSVLLWHLGHTSAPLLCDLSQSGCRLAMSNPPPVGTEVKITISGLPARHATLRWTREGEAGFAFREMLSFAEVAAWQCDYDTRFPENRRRA